MTRSQIREKYGISMLESPSVANKELSEKEAAEYEDCVSLHLRMFDEIDENIEKFCSRCKYYRTAESDKVGYDLIQTDRKSTRLNSSHPSSSRMPSSA